MDHRATVGDSAGVRVISNAPPSQEDTHLDLAGTPVLTIGAAAGPAEQLLFRVAGAVRLTNGEIVVADGGSLQLRYFDSSGRHIRSVGGQGNGPGELSFLMGLWRIQGDTLLAFDPNRRTVSVFDGRGEYIRSFAVEGSLRGALHDGSIVVTRSTDEQWLHGISRSPITVFHLDREGFAESPWAEFPGNESSTVVEGGGASLYPVLFGRRVHVAAAGGRLAVGNDDGYRIRIYSPDGDLLFIVSRQDEPVRVDPSQFDRYVADLLEGVTNPQIQQRIEIAFGQMPRHSTYPAYEAVRIAEDGTLWIQDPPVPELEGAQMWQVYSPEGYRQGAVSIPPRSRVLDVGRDHVLTLSRDSLDIERVQLHNVAFTEDGED